MADEQARREGREGSRWINVRPSGEEVADWFKENVPIHDGLKAEDYVSGITLIQQKEKSKEVTGWNGGQPVISEREHLVFVPYAKVETRVKYFHDLMALKAEEWVGVIEPVEVEAGQKLGLPPGFFQMSVQPTKGSQPPQEKFVCASMRVRVFKRGTIKQTTVMNTKTGQQRVETTGEMVLDAPPGTKASAVLNRYGEPDPFALMKAETGAVGRALALAGMLVIPGTGVASAEDMQESQGVEDQQQPAPAGPPAPQDDRSPEEIDREMRERAGRAIAELRTGYPAEYKVFTEWAKGRSLGDLKEVSGPVLRGLVQKAERSLQEAVDAAEAPDADHDDPGPDEDAPDPA